MKAWLIQNISDLSKDKKPLFLADIPKPVPKEKQILIKVHCCGVCHTELDEIEGRTSPPNFPVVPGHQVVGVVEECGANAHRFTQSDRVGVAWIFSACGQCEYCLKGLENLCPDFMATGRDRNGGYAEYMVIDESFAFKIPDEFSDLEVAPLLCAGAIGYRALMLAALRDFQILGLMGFGASAHLVLKMAKYLYPQSKIFVIARNLQERQFALELGADWAGDISETPPHHVNAFIDTTPAWKTVVAALLQLKPSGRLVINAIRKESIDQTALLEIRYQDHLWMEKEIKTVANITRSDVEKFLALAASIPIKPEVEIYPFEKANEAIVDLKRRHVKGAKVIVFPKNS